jgi:hypothetical protein
VSEMFRIKGSPDELVLLMIPRLQHSYASTGNVTSTPRIVRP